MDKETTEFFQTMFDSVNREIGSVKQEVGSVKQEVGSLRQEVGSLRQEVRSFGQDLGSFTKEVETRFATKEDLERTETKLLTAFHNWARGHELRTRSLSSLEVGFAERLALVEDRVSELERQRGHA